MSKKYIAFTIIACIAFSAIGFAFGYNMPHETGKNEQDNASEATDSDDKYVGLYISNTIKNNEQPSVRFYKDHKCSNEENEQQNHFTCTWSVEDGTIIRTYYAGGVLGRTIEQCEEYLQSKEYRGKDAKLVELREGEKKDVYHHMVFNEPIERDITLIQK